jgi:Arm DNA-binding domain
VKHWTVKQCESAAPGRHCVSESLYLFVTPNGAKRWIFRFTSPRTKRVTESGLGSYDVLTLAEARAKVHDYRRMVAKGVDPIDEKRGKDKDSVTFAVVAADYIQVQSRVFRNQGSVKNMQTLLLNHASALGSQPVSQIGSAHVMNALRPVWLNSPDQGRRAMAACLRVLRYAKANGLTTASTAEMREDLQGAILAPTA